MASINNKTLLIIACILALIGWIVALAGVARTTDLCNKHEKDNQWRGWGGYDCDKAWRYDWWGIWFTFFLTIVLIIMAWFDKVGGWVSTLQAFCAACLSVTMIDTHNWIGISESWNGDSEDAANAALAGFIIICIALFLIIIFLGMGGAGVNVNVSISKSSKTSPEKESKPTKSVDNA
ncbi:hypothetical protein GPECTOR_1g368 [Gonium pectorale]|uniref:Uncharacterized protein n=1 Tax=Gonium pectorale TaxID=33097 RepID=A0A150H328_GONPE|nr:hypothetical protein GPECTOR_1g368 [Gonium pectorale]|eukprot:KXZ56413.1 hypothetical protein GPECTOR_1g368 [Gonium pectorale]